MERSDLVWYAAAVWAAERVLSRRTGTLAGFSPREVEFARSLRKRRRTVYVPNVVPPTEEFGHPAATGIRHRGGYPPP
ncbi:hypothetical protein ACWIID_28280 [Streptomyces phaeochromogenes]